MFLTNKDLLASARQGGYAVGAFNISNLESLLAVVEAAQEERSPVVIAVTPSSVRYAGLSYIANIAKTAVKSSSLVASLHLDHGKDLKTISRCIDAGFTSVMIDGSHLDFEKNVSLTKRTVDLARPNSVTVEAELGRLEDVGASTEDEREAVLTDPEDARRFVDRTEVDALAVAIGTSHGAYKFKGQARLDLERLRAIQRRVDVPLVLHGASSVPTWVLDKAVKYGAELAGARGIPPDHVQKAISLGIVKVNIDTDIRLAFTGSLRGYLHENPRVFDPRKILGSAKEAMRKVVRDKMLLFGSSGRSA